MSSLEKKSMLAEFRPTIVFLLKFVGLYVGGNILYGMFITSYEPEVDVVTRFITHQSSLFLNLLGWDSQPVDLPGKPTTYIEWNGKGIVSVYEGCNALNVIIVFASFVFSFGPLNRKLWTYLPLSLLVIYLANIARIVLLFFVVIYLNPYVYFAHKYFFTASIYAVVLVLWVWWIRINDKRV